MSQNRRTSTTKQSGKISSGVLLAKVVSYLDPEFMGGLEVTLLRNQGNTIGETQQTYSVKYATPFYGVTAYEYMGVNKTDFNDTQKSYGMWFPTPEIGTTVLVVFADGDPAQGYFIACIPGRFMNHMIPAIGTSENVELTDDDKEFFDSDQPLPVGEVNRKINALEKSLDVDKIKKPIHPIAAIFRNQGLLEDDVRGATPSTSRRNVPNTVFGISTPGPVDRKAGSKKEFIGKKQSRTTNTVPVSRVGGSQFVMDDGDDRFLRLLTPGEGPVEYVDTLDANETRKGNTNIPYNEYVRLRTRTGHQILMHNSEDLIYIGNSKGTTWIELTSNGKIDIFAEESISIHTKQDLNLRADRDINMESGRNINMRTAAGRLHADVNGNLEVAVSGNSFLTTLSDLNVRTTGNNRVSSGSNLDISAGGSSFISSAGGCDISAGEFTVDIAGLTSINSAAIVLDTKSKGGDLHLNGPAGPAATAATEAESTQTLNLFENVVIDSDNEWGNKTRYRSETYLKSIMRRIPMHEPWPLHEHFNPVIFSATFTDRDRPSGEENGNSV
jgi:hypothetical protein